MTGLSDYGEQVKGWEPFRLDRLDHRHHRYQKMIHWRLSFNGIVIGYASTAEDDAEAAVGQLFAEKAKRADAWEQEPSAIVRGRSGHVEAMFLHPRTAMEWIAAQKFPDMFTAENTEGRKIVGTTSHGHAILDILDRKS